MLSCTPQSITGPFLRLLLTYRFLLFLPFLANYSGTKLLVSALEFIIYPMDSFIKEGMSLFFQDCKPSLQHRTQPCHLLTPGTHGRPCHPLRALKFPPGTAKRMAGLDHRLLGLNTFSLEERNQNTDVKQMLPAALSISTFPSPLLSWRGLLNQCSTPVCSKKNINTLERASFVVKNPVSQGHRESKPWSVSSTDPSTV